MLDRLGPRAPELECELNSESKGRAYARSPAAQKTHPVWIYDGVTLPTDIRHNSKIRREELAVWAEKQLRKQEAGW